MVANGPWTRNDGTQFFIVPAPDNTAFVFKEGKDGSLSEPYPTIRAAFIAGMKHGTEIQ